MSIESDSPVVYHGTSESRFPKNEVQNSFENNGNKKSVENQPLQSVSQDEKCSKLNIKPQITLQLSTEEKEILRQCNKESLYYRCLPFAIAGMAATHLAVRKGYINPHPVWGSTISMTGAAFLGWIVGKVSYKTKCEDKFVHLENSIIGESIRKKRGISFERYHSDFAKTQSSGDNLTLRDDPSFTYYSDSNYHPSTGSLNLDVDKNIQYSGLDDRERPSTDREAMPYMEENETGTTKKFTTYEELRNRNREEYERSQRSYSLKVDVGSPSGIRPWSNLESTPPRRYNSELTNSPIRRTGSDGDNWDNAKML